MLSSCGLSIQGAEGDLSRWGNTGRLFSTDEMLELKLTQTRKFCILQFHEGVTGDWCGGFEVFLHSLSNEQLSCLILKHAGSVACWFMPYHKLASLFPSISLTHSNTPTVVLLVLLLEKQRRMNMLVLLLEKQRRRMNMHDVIQVWHTVHAAMHCVSSSTAACNALCFSASQARKGRPGPDVWNSNVYLPLPPDMCMCACCIFQARVVMDQQSHTGTGSHSSSPRSITKARQQVCGLPRGSPRTTGAGKRNHMVRP